jgi:hypothetical protein
MPHQDNNWQRHLRRCHNALQEVPTRVGRIEWRAPDHRSIHSSYSENLKRGLVYADRQVVEQAIPPDVSAKQPVADRPRKIAHSVRLNEGLFLVQAYPESLQYALEH